MMAPYRNPLRSLETVLDWVSDWLLDWLVGRVLDRVLDCSSSNVIGGLLAINMSCARLLLIPPCLFPPRTSRKLQRSSSRRLFILDRALRLQSATLSAFPWTSDFLMTSDPSLYDDPTLGVCKFHFELFVHITSSSEVFSCHEQAGETAF